MEAITLQKVIIHKVDHINYDRPLLSDLESPISEEVGGFLTRQIVNNFEHKYSRSAVFNNGIGDENSVQVLCDAMILDPMLFVSKSQQVAIRLYNVINNNRYKKNISPGDLVVCTFCENTNQGKQWVALLKVDPEDGFAGERVEINGKVQTVLRRIKNVIPTGELQKCAFILPSELRNNNFHLKVLDQQAARYGIKKLVASFFMVDFLQCDVVINPSDQTNIFIYGSQEWVNGKQEIWSQNDINLFIEQTQSIVQNEIVNIAEFAQGVIPTIDEQDDYIDYMIHNGVRDLTFAPDPNTRNRLTKYSWFEGENNLLVRIDPEAIGEQKTLFAEYNPNERVWKVNLSTSKWERVTRSRS